jgi:hypothetical protein
MFFLGTPFRSTTSRYHTKDFHINYSRDFVATLGRFSQNESGLTCTTAVSASTRSGTLCGPFHRPNVFYKKVADRIRWQLTRSKIIPFGN